MSSELPEKQGNLEEIWDELEIYSEKTTFPAISHEILTDFPLNPALSRAEVKGTACFYGSYEGKPVLIGLKSSGEVSIRSANPLLRQSLLALLSLLLK